MSEWWTYRLSDFLMFSSETYFGLFELYHRSIWPLQFAALLAGIVILFCLLRQPVWSGRAVALILAAAWIWVGWAFQLEHYATINWGAKWFAALFAAGALVLFWSGVIRDHLQLARITDRRQWPGVILFLSAFLAYPPAAVLAGRSWVEMELFALTPDATAIGTMGILLCTRKRTPIVPLTITLLWCAISGSTLWTMRSPEAWVVAVAAVVGLASLLLRRIRVGSTSGADQRRVE